MITNHELYYPVMIKDFFQARRVTNIKCFVQR